MPVRLLQLAVGQAQGLRPLLHLALEILRVLPHRRDHAVEGAGELADFIPAMVVRERDVASPCHRLGRARQARSEEHTSELPSLMRISYAVFCLKNKTQK